MIIYIDVPETDFARTQYQFYVSISLGSPEIKVVLDEVRRITRPTSRHAWRTTPVWERLGRTRTPPPVVPKDVVAQALTLVRDKVTLVEAL